MFCEPLTLKRYSGTDRHLSVRATLLLRLESCEKDVWAEVRLCFGALTAAQNELLIHSMPHIDPLEPESASDRCQIVSLILLIPADAAQRGWSMVSIKTLESGVKDKE